MTALEAMKKRSGSIGEVRGLGLMIGVELVSDAAKTPAAGLAEEVRSELLKRGILVGVGGINGNVVRIQPPLVISNEQIDVVLRELESVLVH